MRHALLGGSGGPQKTFYCGRREKSLDCLLFFRVLRQIFQSSKQIVDVILLLLFIVAFFALIGEFQIENGSF